jgi:serine/threonine-protein kinase
LDYAHRHAVIHRDIKPENILLFEGEAMVADFGIALAVKEAGEQRLTETGLSLGTPQYMGPEQATGDRQPTATSDVYSLGCVLYEMLAGDPPFLGSNVQAVIAKVITEKPVKLRTIRDTVPEHIEAAVDKALAKVTTDRFDSAAAFADALRDATAVVSVAKARVPLAGWGWRRSVLMALPFIAVAVALWGLRGWGNSTAPVLGGGTIRPLTSFTGWEWSPSWSPDGNMITYSHIVGGDADVATLSSGGGDPHILTEASPADEFIPRWSPDGSKIAYISDRGAGTDVYWISPTGGAEHKVAETGIPFLERMGTWAGAMGANPWSPDGQELIFSRLHETGEVALWKVNLSTREQTQLTTPPSDSEDLFSAWSPDGNSIVFVRNDEGDGSMLLLPPDGGEPSEIFNEPTFGLVAMPAWFPDNRRLAFSSIRGGALNLWEINLNTRDLRQLTVGAGFDWAPAVARDGSIAYVQFGHQIDLHWVRVDAPEEEHERLTSFTGANFGARVSPDGDQVVYYSLRSGNWDLWVLDRATSQHRQITDHPAGARLPDWSPDGREIVYLSARDGAIRLWVVETETGLARRLSDHVLPWSTHEAETANGPRWSPDGSVIGYLAATENGNAIWLVATDGTDARPSSIRNASSFGWYRDDVRVVYTRRAPDGSGAVELRAAHLETGEDVLLRAGAIAEVTVSPDGSALSFIEAVSHFTMELYLLRLDPPSAPSQLPTAVGEPQQLTFGDGVWHVHSGGWAPDGSGLVYSRDRDFGDIYVIESGTN